MLVVRDLLSKAENEKKNAQRRKHCALAVEGGAKNFRPAADPPSLGRGTAKI